jgi:hypothetical protein
MGRFLHHALLVTKAVHELFDGTSTSTLTLTGTKPSVSFRCRVTVSSVTNHTDCVGNVVVGGESLAFNTTTTQSKLTTSTLTALPVVTTANLDCYILIECINISGQPIQYTTETALPCKIEQVSKRVQEENGSWTSIQATRLQARGISVGDQIKFDIANPFDPTNGITYPIATVRPKASWMGRESIKIAEF